MPFITGYISNDLRYADLRGANLKFQCPLSRATFQTLGSTMVLSLYQVSMPFITGYISNEYVNKEDRIRSQFQCPLSRATFQTRWTRSCSRSNFVSMPFITGYISNLVLLMINYRWKECFNALYHGLHFKQEKYNKIFVIKMFQCPLSRATFQTLALGMPLFTRFKSHFAGESKFFPANLPFYV